MLFAFKRLKKKPVDAQAIEASIFQALQAEVNLINQATDSAISATKKYPPLKQAAAAATHSEP